MPKQIFLKTVAKFSQKTTSPFQHVVLIYADRPPSAPKKWLRQHQFHVDTFAARLFLMDCVQEGAAACRGRRQEPKNNVVLRAWMHMSYMS